MKQTHHFFLAEHEIMAKMQSSFEHVAKLESDVMSECKLLNLHGSMQNTNMSFSAC